MIPQTRTRIFFLAILAAVLFDGVALAQGYRIAGNVEGFSGFRSAAINESGKVAFTANRSLGATGISGAYIGASGGFRILVEGPFSASGIKFTSASAVDINNKGQVVFRGTIERITGISTAIRIGTQPVNETDFSANSRSFPFIIGGSLLSNDLTINDADSVQYAGNLFVPDPQALNQEADINGISVQGLADGNRILAVRGGSGGAPVWLISFGVLKNGPGPSHIGPVSTNVIGTIPASIQSVSAVVMNRKGDVAIQGQKADGTFAIYKLGGEVVIEGSEFSFIRSIAINDRGVVAFYARSGTLRDFGFFKGSNPLTDKIVLTGDSVGGTALPLLSPFSSETRWFNSAGQIVFSAFDSLGNVGLWVASGGTSPTGPASAVVRWSPTVSPPSGKFDETNNWRPQNADSPRTPQKNTTLNDTALFDLPAVYSVELGAQHAERFIVKNGDVTFKTGGITVDASSFEEPSALIDNAHATFFANAGITNRHALIGRSGAARLDVIEGGIWESQGSLTVGEGAEGILNINNLGSVRSAEARIGTGAGGGEATVTTDGFWSTGNIAVGIGGRGKLTIKDGGRVESEAGVIGVEPGLGNVVTVQGGSSRGPSLWQAGFLNVGDKGSGRLEVKEGGSVDTLVLAIAGGRRQDITGSVTVGGAGANSTPSKITAAAIRMGEAGVSDLLIENGGVIETSQALFGEGRGLTSVTITGAGSKLVVAGSLFVGDLSSAGILVEEGGALVTERTTISEGVVPPIGSEVKIVGKSSFFGVDSELTVGSDGDPANGTADLTLADGVVSADTIEVRRSGRILGFGDLSGDLVNNGFISPGFSPGTITLQGNFTQSDKGRLLIEIGGTNSVEYDRLIVTDNAALNGQITLRFINGFSPKAGQKFDFLNVGGNVSGAFAAKGVQNLAPGFQFNIATEGSLLSVTALNDGTFDAALPGKVEATITNIGGITYVVCVTTSSNTCASIAVDGRFTRTDNSFYQSFQGTTFIPGNCVNAISTATNILTIGALSPGTYSFNIVSAGQTRQTIPFTVPAAIDDTLLNPIHLLDGSVQFQFQGVDFPVYSIEASADLKDWIELQKGLSPGTYVDPDAAIFPQRFYRATALTR